MPFSAPQRALESEDAKRLYEELREKERVLTTLIRNLDGMVYRCRCDEHWTMEFVSEGCVALTGYKPRELVGNAKISYEILTHPDERRPVRDQIEAAVAKGERFSIEYRIVCRDGTVKWVWETGVGVPADDGRVRSLEGFIQDLTQRKAADHALIAAEARYRSIFENATEGIFQTTPEGRYIDANPALARIYGYASPRELLDTLRDIEVQLYVEPGRRAEFVRQMQLEGRVINFVSQVRRKDGIEIWISENAHVVRNSENDLLYFEGTVTDITDTRRYQQELEYHATFDALTGLPNRMLLYDRINQAIAHAKRFGGTFAVAFVDLDNFKLVNDSLGHDVGDRLLQAMAQRMTACLREGDTVARQGGDEFVLVYAIKDTEAFVPLGRVLEAVSSPWQAPDRELRITCSVGASIYPLDGADAASLLKSADVAMYSAKGAGRNTTRFFTKRMISRAQQRLDTEQNLRLAIDRNEFVLHYQPRVDLASGAVNGMEALLRWCRDGHITYPDQFISVAEETGLIMPIGQWVIRAACEFNSAVTADALSHPLIVAVNLSVRQCQDDLVEQIAQALGDAGLAPQALELEITESVFMHDVEHFSSMFARLGRLGVRLTIDDFGTGYSSLRYLKRLPVERLKIDRSFVRDICTDVDDASIVKAVISLGHSLGMRVVAEGVETAEQLAFLRAHGCDEAQGFFFGHPLPENPFLDHLHRKAVFRPLSPTQV